MELQAIQPHIRPQENYGVSPPGKHFQTHQEQGELEEACRDLPRPYYTYLNTLPSGMRSLVWVLKGRELDLIYVQDLWHGLLQSNW